ncbi:hypothetical protein ASPCADRAFT_135053 [Aspergillus carbonarius ITEM 5010]|uniref:Uncharacterized protein n=1 Tax=Aspergillus carbonarius (strain ITEM 5010) TaxID=602072 RepID=A0A1R3R7Z0_ASPC5|nr:hypothetical protein ASPCADRAFT_135053 [Aspergillus carbonarius ITEM 5010]
MSGPESERMDKKRSSRPGYTPRKKASARDGASLLSPLDWIDAFTNAFRSSPRPPRTEESIPPESDISCQAHKGPMRESFKAGDEKTNDSDASSKIVEQEDLEVSGAINTEGQKENKYTEKIQGLESALQLSKGELLDQQLQFRVEIKNRDTQINYLRHKITTLQHEIQSQETDRRELQCVVAAAQEGALRSMARGSWVPMEDRIVRDELTKLQEALRIWARGYSVTNITDVQHVPKEELDTVIKLLDGYCVQASWDSLTAQMTIPPARIPMIIVQALLAKHIFTMIFADPFFAFAVASRTLGLPGQRNMQILYETMKQHDSEKAHTWRSLMLRVLSNSPMDSMVQPLLSTLLEPLISDLVGVWLNCPASVLLRPAKNDLERERQELSLRKLYQTAAELGLSLWAQRTFMTCHGLHHLKAFHASSEQMTAHRLHQLDEDDDRLDGSTILLCVQPLVLAFGNEHGEHYDISKVWAKATVVVADPEVE